MKAEAKNQKVEVGAFYFNYNWMLCKKIAVMLLSAYLVPEKTVADIGK